MIEVSRNISSVLFFFRILYRVSALLSSVSSFANLSSRSKMADVYVTLCGNRRE